MEMESSRRSAMDRSREPGLKKPRLSDEPPNRDRPLPPTRPSDPRLRAVAEREDPTRGGLASSYQRQQQQQQELVALYRSALAELTFNSKPIITNLTIIAGENLHAAKAISATICANVLEVPTDQKLPSLYLLDSIVKNIGRDYIKHFAARLPEVFCKAYKQVDSSIHPSMRHLFGTWKGVFPPGPLQTIEKELGFTSTVNSSSGTTASRPDSQTQRPSHSIHVNPKYLEARQHLQQSSRSKEIGRDDLTSSLTSIPNVERSDRMPTSGSARQWEDLPMKTPTVQQSQREQFSESVLENKSYGEYEFSSNYSRHDLGVGRVSETIKERDGLGKPWYGSGSTSSQTVADRKNGFEISRGYGKYQESGAADGNRQLPPLHINVTNKNSQPTSKSWKNSEEEEYMWEDINSRPSGYGGSSGLIKAGQVVDDPDKPASMLHNKWMPLQADNLDSQESQFQALSHYVKSSRVEDRASLSREVEDDFPPSRRHPVADARSSLEISSDSLLTSRASLGHHTSSVWSTHEPTSSAIFLDQISSRSFGQSEGQPISLSGGLSAGVSSSSSRAGLLSHNVPSSTGPSTNIASGSRGTFRQHAQKSLQPPSSSSYVPPSALTLQHQKPCSSADHDHQQLCSLSQTSQKQVPVSGHSIPAHLAASQESFQSHGTMKLQDSFPQSQYLRSSSASSVPSKQSKHNLPILQSSQSDLPLQQAQVESPQPAMQMEKQSLLPPNFGSHQTGGVSVTSHSNNPPIEVSGQSSTSNLLAAIIKGGLLPDTSSNNLQNLNAQPPLPTGPPPIHTLASGPSVTPSSLPPPASCINTGSLTHSPITSVLPPLPPGPPPPSSLLNTAPETTSTARSTSNSLSRLLSSLVAQGLISSPASELPAVSSSQSPDKLQNKKSTTDSSTSVAPSTRGFTEVPASVEEHSLPGIPAVSNIALPGSTTDLKPLIGLDFKPEVIREHHLLVISSLFDDLKHQCNKCGLRFRLQEQLDSHLDWHALEKPISSKFDSMSRKWYANLEGWVGGSMGPFVGLASVSSLEEVLVKEDCEPMVPADETQSLCALCGEPFEDFYSEEKDEWMYKGTVYLNEPVSQGGKGSIDDSVGQALIVHSRCI